MSLFGWLRRKPKYAIWIDRTDNGRHIARIVCAKDANMATAFKSGAFALHTFFMMPISGRKEKAADAWGEAMESLNRIGADSIHLTRCYVEREDGLVRECKEGESP